MNVIDWLKTIYLGDRGCKSILIDAWREELKIQVTCISRVRSTTWEYYTDEDIPDGLLVFEGMKSVAFEPSGLIPNDLINDIQAEPLADEEGKYLVTMSVGSVDATGHSTEIIIQVRADSMALEDPRKPRVRIRN